MLRASHLTRRFMAPRRGERGVIPPLSAGEGFALLGPTGTGKATTLVSEWVDIHVRNRG